ncbi:(2Fe-2S)-binding protein [Variibacter gotjawalensis]|uniref:(2Fe-2S)-binding protein n=1 Tax=Variibacter gotjawalensis TaxID=1333996 RepID=UPI000BBB3398|nr:(2Fe-2S)-binding protein [Variibacter gotjawalensis]RZS49385.1 BFD-like [2Fe-2S] binding protein [Variibacter gotjawalensis]
MIVCSCNVFSDTDVRKVCTAARPQSTGAVYGCLGCSAQCGRCARTIRKIMDEALQGACPVGCATCPAGTHADAQLEIETTTHIEVAFASTSAA